MPKTPKHELQIRYEVTAEPDEQPIRGHFASGDDAADRELEDELIRRADSGDVWAWCQVRVTAIAEDGTRAHSGWLGASSYESEANFRDCNDYFADMCSEAAHALFDVRQSHRQGIQTKYLGPTNARGARVKVWAQAGSMIVSWDHALNPEDNHAAAARAYAERWGWTGRWIGGATPDGTGYLFVNDRGPSDEYETVIDPDAQCREHGCARWRCDDAHEVTP